MKLNKNAIKTVVVLSILILLLGGVKGYHIYKAITGNAFHPQPEGVTATVAKGEVWRSTFSAIGTLMAVQGVTISAEEAGTVSKITFESGSQVNQGDLLIEIDPSVEEAELKGAIAWSDRMQKAFERAQKLRVTNAVSADELDNASGQNQKALSDMESLKAKIAKKKIIAPFAGRTGIRTVNVGDYLKQGDPIVPLYSLENLFVNFSLPQQSIGKLAVGAEVAITVDAFPGQEFTGKINAINPNVSDTNRNVDIQAKIQNDGEKLRPGMFVNVTVSLNESSTVIALPVTSINYAPYGDSVFIIEKMKGPDNVEYDGVRQQIVKVGTKRGDQVAIEAGVKEGEQIVTSGLFKLRQGAAVIVNNQFAPSDSKNPTPADT